MAFIFEMPHILMSIIEKEKYMYRYIDIVLYISSTLECNSNLPQFDTLLRKIIYKCTGHFCIY